MSEKDYPLLSRIENDLPKDKRANLFAIGGYVLQTIADFALVTCDAVRDELEDELKIHKRFRDTK